MTFDFPARLVVSITPADVGRRISLRRRLPTGGYSDVVGVLESWAEGTLKVRRRGGELVEVAEATMAAAKVVPPPPVRASRERPPEDPR
ncbi:MAG TPA: hypothetical protein VFU43_13695 [Streptosporangiaceae bacterium]|nr:hypothetical protein [Streptosporangiaceae bacterium]